MSSHNGGSFSHSASFMALSTGAESQVGSPPDGREPASSYSDVVPALALALALPLAFALALALAFAFSLNLVICSCV